MTRDVAPRMGFNKPALIESIFFPALQVFLCCKTCYFIKLVQRATDIHHSANLIKLLILSTQFCFILLLTVFHKSISCWVKYNAAKSILGHLLQCTFSGWEEASLPPAAAGRGGFDIWLSNYNLRIVCEKQRASYHVKKKHKKQSFIGLEECEKLR